MTNNPLICRVCDGQGKKDITVVRTSQIASDVDVAGGGFFRLVRSGSAVSPVEARELIDSGTLIAGLRQRPSTSLI